MLAIAFAEVVRAAWVPLSSRLEIDRIADERCVFSRLRNTA